MDKYECVTVVCWRRCQYASFVKAESAGAIYNCGKVYGRSSLLYLLHGMMAVAGCFEDRGEDVLMVRIYFRDGSSMCGTVSEAFKVYSTRETWRFMAVKRSSAWS